MRQRDAGHHADADQEHNRERKAEQEAHMGGADGAERRGQFALHGVARGLRRGGDDGEDGPEHDLSLTDVMPGFMPGIHGLLSY